MSFYACGTKNAYLSVKVISGKVLIKTNLLTKIKSVRAKIVSLIVVIKELVNTALKTVQVNVEVTVVFRAILFLVSLA
jgi:hypothetical protein